MVGGGSRVEPCRMLPRALQVLSLEGSKLIYYTE